MWERVQSSSLVLALKLGFEPSTKHLAGAIHGLITERPVTFQGLSIRNVVDFDIGVTIVCLACCKKKLVFIEL